MNNKTDILMYHQPNDQLHRDAISDPQSAYQSPVRYDIRIVSLMVSVHSGQRLLFEHFLFVKRSDSGHALYALIKVTVDR